MNFTCEAMLKINILQLQRFLVGIDTSVIFTCVNEFVFSIFNWNYFAKVPILLKSINDQHCGECTSSQLMVTYLAIKYTYHVLGLLIWKVSDQTMILINLCSTWVKTYLIIIHIILTLNEFSYMKTVLITLNVNYNR